VTAVAQLPSQYVAQIWTSPAHGPSPSGHFIEASALLWLLGIALGIISQATILHATFADLRGEPRGLGASLQIALRRFPAALGLSICMALLQGVAALGLIFPAFILMSIWFLAMPACVLEGLGPLSSMGRSSQLTKGHRWKIFGLIAVLFIALLVVSGGLGASLDAIGGAPLKLIGGTVWSAVWGAVFSIAVAVSYHDLRALKEGPGVEADGSLTTRL
jgi:hypothetical protein